MVEKYNSVISLWRRVSVHCTIVLSCTYVGFLTYALVSYPALVLDSLFLFIYLFSDSRSQQYLVGCVIVKQ